MAKRIPEREWEWYGKAGHFIAGDGYRFHLFTLIGKFVIASVGELPSKLEAGEFEEFGHPGTYDTAVFKRSGHRCFCGCGQPDIVPTELECLGANSAIECRANHMAMCEKYASE